MDFLFAEIWMWWVVMAVAGFGAGWLVWGRPFARRRRSLEHRVARAQENWQEVEARLASELERVAALELERSQLVEELERVRATGRQSAAHEGADTRDGGASTEDERPVAASETREARYKSRIDAGDGAEDHAVEVVDARESRTSRRFRSLKRSG